MWEGREQISVAAAPDAVWAIIADLSNHVRLAGSGEVRTITDISGPLGIGTTFRSENVIPKVGDLTATEEIIEWDPPRVMGWRSYPPPVLKRKPASVPDIRWRYELIPEDVGTRVIHSFRIVAPHQGNIPFRLFYLVSRRRSTIVAGVRKTLANLKAMAEGSSAAA